MINYLAFVLGFGVVLCIYNRYSGTKFGLIASEMSHKIGLCCVSGFGLQIFLLCLQNILYFPYKNLARVVSTFPSKANVRWCKFMVVDKAKFFRYCPDI